MTIWDIVHPDDRTYLEELNSCLACATDGHYSWDRRYVRKDRSQFWGRVTTTRLSHPVNGAFAVAIVQDVTEEKLAEQKLSDKVETLKQTLESAVHAMASIVETRDPYTAGHQRRVARLACLIAQGMGLDEERIALVRLAALVHDIGKIAVPAEILSKPGRLSAIEFRLVQDHPQVAFDILSTIAFPWPIAEIVRQHHERLDGSGYPSGLTGASVSLEARIIAVADVVEAMASHRPYRPGFGARRAIAEVEGFGNTLFDPNVVDACKKVLAREAFSLAVLDSTEILSGAPLRIPVHVGLCGESEIDDPAARTRSS